MEHLFIVGVGRSGTTLVQSIFNAHSKIAFTPETHFLYNYLRPGAAEKPISNRQDLIELIKKDIHLGRLSLDWNKLVKNIEIDSNTFVHLFDEFLKAYAEKENVDIVGDKDPMNSGLLPLIKRLYPEAYVLHIIRDPRDVLLSRLKSDWGKKYPLIAHLGDHKVSLEKALSEGPDLFAERYIETRYEDIIEYPESEVKRICESLPVDFEKGMLQFAESSQKLVSEEERKWKGNIFGEIMSNNRNKWKSGLSSIQKELCSLLLGDLISKLSYEKSDKAPFWLFPVKFVFVFVKMYFKRKYRFDNA